MSNVGSQIPVFQGTWSDQPYLRGDLVLRSGVLYQAVTDTSAQPGATAATPGKGNPASWVNVTALVLDFTGSVDPTAGSGIPAAIGSTYHMAGTGLYVKTGSGATAWSNASAGGGPQVVTVLGPFTVTPATANLIEPANSGYLLATLAAGTLVRALPMAKVGWTGSVNPNIYVVLGPTVDAPSSQLTAVAVTSFGNGTAGGALAEIPLVDGQDSRWGLAAVECGVYAQLYSDSGTPNVGETDVYLITMTAAL